ncbi:probable actin interacting protein 1 [Melanopsichium pennsylvanicum]|uniref:Probable actin interacting protein 1 n=2 Tax=Melanopsichium pennsylvanicum TaxID=63383 RepID=A0AAJ4XNC9_9BASI|nr:probable actin interacting protein 1 [Melanopsichium pennsylvanicum 4]SNX85387.1 probable actin interacting protein 1 [Melanopsichium pennsylvanicum]
MSATLHNLLPGNPATTRAQSTKISADPKGEKVVYCQNRTVFVRSITEPSKPALAYSQHTQPTTVARISPTGFYCASADQAGNVRVWDLVGDEQIIKNEVKVIAGRINDLAWDGESKRIIAVGDGRERFGHAFSFDSGSSVGEVTGHSRQINAVAIRKDRPFRAVTAGDDNNLVFYHGAPYKYNKTINTHTRFVQDVAYAPNGDHFVSVGSDSKVFVYDGKTGDTLVELSAKASGGHTGTIFAVCFSPDSKKIATAGADGFVKVWDIAGEKVEVSHDFNGQSKQKVEDQQMGIVWAGNRIISLSFSGQLNVIEQGENVNKLHGACKSFGIRSLDVAEDGKTLLGGSYDGKVLSWSAEGVCKPVTGGEGTSAVLGVHSTRDGVYVVGMDDSVRKIEDGVYSGAAVPTSSQPKGSAASTSGVVVVVGASGIDIIENGNKSHTPIKYTPTSVTISADASHVAVGAEDGKVYLYTHTCGTLSEYGILTNNRSAVTALGFDSQLSLLAAGESNGKIQVYDFATKSLKIAHWVFHSARINDVKFSPDGTHAISASLDTHVYVWSVKKPMKNIAIKNAHANGVQAVAWLSNDEFASAGADAVVKTWKFKRHEGA